MYQTVFPNLDPKIPSCLSWLKIGSLGNLEELIPNPDLAFLNSYPKIHFLANLGRKVKVISFAWKSLHMLSGGSWFLFQHYFSELATLNPFLGKFGPKSSKFSILTENWHIGYLEDADSYCDISFLNFQLHFWANLSWKSHSR